MLKDNRLRLLAEMTPSCNTAADIGTDHGFLGCELLETGRCCEVWFTDRSSPSLDKARQLVQQKMLSNRSHFFVGDGALPLPGTPDAAIIAGMGGHTIVHILEQGTDKLRDAKLILGPNTALAELRKWLSQHEYNITDEAAVCEAEKFYVILCAEAGKMELCEDDIIVGPVLKEKTDRDTRAYFQYRLRGACLALARAGESKSADLQKLRKETERWQKYL